MKQILTLCIMAGIIGCGQSKNKPAADTVQTKIKDDMNKEQFMADTLQIQLDITLTESFERFDRELYDQLNDKKESEVRKTLPDGTLLNMFDYYGGRGFSQGILPPDSYFSLEKKYYRDGKIRNKGWEWEFRKGVWYEFDEDGNLTARTDYDAPYTFTWEDVLEYCRKNSIDVVRHPWGHYEPTSIDRGVEDGKYRWSISHEVEYGGHEILTLDGKTGELLNKHTTYDE
jgi:hypothetical protein